MYKYIRKHFFLFLIIFLISISIYFFFRTNTPSSNNHSDYRAQLLKDIYNAGSFDEFTNLLFCYESSCDTISTAYTLKSPEEFQIPNLKPTLSSFSYKKYKKEKERHSDTKNYSNLINTLTRYNASSLTEKEKITYSLLQNHFTLNKELSTYSYYEELLGPSSGIPANLPITLCEYPLYSEENIQTYLTLLTQLPDFFHDIILYEKQRDNLGYETPIFLLQKSKENVGILIESLKKDNNCFTETFQERIIELNLSSKKSSNYLSKNQKYIKKYVLSAYEDLYKYIENTISIKKKNLYHPKKKKTAKSSNILNKKYLLETTTPYGLSTLPNGKKYYSLLVKHATGSTRNIPELIEITDTTLKKNLETILNIAITDEPAYHYYCKHPHHTCYESPESILEALSLMIRKDYPILPNPPRYQLKSVPKSLCSSSSPAFYMIPAIDDYKNNTIYINPLYTGKENGNLFTTLAHEGFPGHMYQTVYFNETKPSPIRQSLNYPGYVEGWATYVEINSFNFLKYPPKGTSLPRLYQADSIINLALCSRIDLGVNYENWTLDDVDKFFAKHGFRNYFSADLYSYVVEAPANYLSYFIGYLEIVELKEEYKKLKMEQYSEINFHKRILEIGPSDFITLKKFLLK